MLTPVKVADKTAVQDQTLQFVDLGALGQPIVGQRIRARRRLADISQAELAMRANVTQTDVSRLENNPRDCRLRVFAAVCGALSITVADLLEAAVRTVDNPNESKLTPE